MTVLRLVGAAAAGALLALGFPPFEWTSLSWLGLFGLVWLTAGAPNRRTALWSGYLFGLAYFGLLLWWLTRVELIAFYPLVMVQAAAALITAGAVYRYREAPPWAFVLAAAGSAGLAEFLRVRWPIGGFPWGSIGATVGPTPLRPSLQWVGATGWGVLLAGLAALAVLVVRRRMSWKAMAGAAAAVCALGLAGNLWAAVPRGEEREAVIVQGNSPCPGVRCPGERQLIYENHLSLTRGLEPGMDLVVWPESSTGGRADPLRDPEVIGAIGAEAVRLGAVILVGGDLDAGPGRFENVNAVFGPDGEIVGRYLKQHPVPFGEYVPARAVLGWLPALARVPRDMVRGEGQVLFDLDGAPFGSVISYEGAYARYERGLVRAGASFVVLATNEASFGETPASDQLIAISRVRAAELGVDIVHAAVYGAVGLRLRRRAGGGFDGPVRGGGVERCGADADGRPHPLRAVGRLAPVGGRGGLPGHVGPEPDLRPPRESADGQRSRSNSGGAPGLLIVSSGGYFGKREKFFEEPPRRPPRNVV